MFEKNVCGLWNRVVLDSMDWWDPELTQKALGEGESLTLGHRAGATWLLTWAWQGLWSEKHRANGLNRGLDSFTFQTSPHGICPPEAVQRWEEGSKLELYQAENNHQSGSQ